MEPETENNTSMLKKLAIVVIIVVAVVASLILISKGRATTKNEEVKKPMDTNQPQATQSAQTLPFPIVDKTKRYEAVVTTTEGNITIELNVGKTPITVSSFIYLAKKNFYDNTIFHRVIKGFMIQGGDPKGDGTGGPGYEFNNEPITDSYGRGTVAMANAGPNTNGSQFFIMHQDYDLPKDYVIFGKVSAGIEVVDKIATAPVSANPITGEQSKPVSPVSIKSIQIVEK